MNGWGAKRVSVESARAGGIFLALALGGCGGATKPVAPGAGGPASDVGGGGFAGGASGSAVAGAAGERSPSDSGGEGGTVDAGADAGASGGDGMAGSTSCVDACRLDGPACCSPAVSCVAATGSCVLEVLTERVDVIYTYAELEQKVASLAQDVEVSLTDADIVWAAIEQPPASRIELHLSAQASALSGDALEQGRLHPFRVSCDGQSLFVGVIYNANWAAALRTPVLDVSRDSGDSLILRLGAWEGAWAAPGFAGDPGARERIDRPELRAAFCRKGVLQELAAP